MVIATSIGELLLPQRVWDLNPWKVLVLISFKLIALNHSANSLKYLLNYYKLVILLRIELRQHPYQERTLPFKLKNLYIYLISFIQEHSDLNWESEVWSFKFYH